MSITHIILTATDTLLILFLIGIGPPFSVSSTPLALAWLSRLTK